MSTEVIHVSLDQAGVRLDKFLADYYASHSRTYFQTAINQGLVFLNGIVPKKRARAEAGDEIEVTFAPIIETSIKPEEIPLDILYEDESMLAIHKPADMVVHPAVGNWNGTLVNALLHYCQSLPGDELRPGIVHRLDKETSGVLLAAKTLEAHSGLVSAFAERSVQKEYLAVCVGNPGIRIIDAPIGRHPKDRKRFAVVEGGKAAVTECEVLATSGRHSLLKIKPRTGRTHQIRVHLHSVGTPVAGDVLYGSRGKFERQMLHAYRYSFFHPITEQWMEIEACPPSDFIQATSKNPGLASITRSLLN